MAEEYEIVVSRFLWWPSGLVCSKHDHRDHVSEGSSSGPEDRGYSATFIESNFCLAEMAESVRETSETAKAWVASWWVER